MAGERKCSTCGWWDSDDHRVGDDNSGGVCLRTEFLQHDGEPVFMGTCGGDRCRPTRWTPKGKVKPRKK